MNVTSFLNTFIQIFVFFFTYFPFIKASTLDNNIVSLLDFWLFFWTPSYRYTSHSLPLSRSRLLTHLYIHTCIRIHSFSLSLSLSSVLSPSLSLSFLKNISWCTISPCFSCITWFQRLVQFYDLNIASVSQLVCRQHDYLKLANKVNILTRLPLLRLCLFVACHVCTHVFCVYNRVRVCVQGGPPSYR